MLLYVKEVLVALTSSVNGSCSVSAGAASGAAAVSPWDQRDMEEYQRG